MSTINDSSMTTPTGQKKKASWLKRLLVVFGILIMLPLLAAVIARLIYSDSYIKEKVQAALRETFGRDVVVDGLECSLLSGKLKISGIVVPNAAGEVGFKEKDTARIAGLDCQFSLISLAWSSGRDLRGFKLVVRKPEMYLERKDSKTNVDDLIKKFTSGPPGTWPKNTGLSGLGLEISVEDGVFSFNDSDPVLGESRLEQLSLQATQEALGSPLISKLKFALKTPSANVLANASGQMEMESRLNWIDAAGVIDLRAFRDISSGAKFTQMDMPHVLRYVGGQKEVVGQNQKESKPYICTLGKPQSGEFKLTAPTLENISIEAHFDTDGAISLFEKEKNKWVAGDLPAKAVLKAQFGVVNGALKEGPVSLKFVVGASKAALEDTAKMPLLDFQVLAAEVDGKNRTYDVALKTTQELLASDVAKVLGLTGNIKGILEGQIHANMLDNRLSDVTGTLKTSDGKANALDASFGIKFGSKMSSVNSSVPDNAELNFQVRAGTAIEMSSLRPAKISSLSDLSKLSVDAEMNIKVLGKELFDEFSPMLTVIGFKDRLEESLLGKLIVSGNAGKVHLDLDGTLQQQRQTPNPIHLALLGDYDGVALVEQNDAPWLKLDAQIKSVADQSIDLNLPLSITRGKTKQIYAIPQITAKSDLAGLLQLNRRLGSYGVVLPPEYTFAGNVVQAGKFLMTETLDAQSVVTERKLELDLDLKLSQLQVHGPALSKDAPLFNWSEKELKSHVGLELNQQLLSLKSLALESSILSLDAQVDEVDCLRIKNLCADKNSKISDWAAVVNKGLTIKTLNTHPVELLKLAQTCGVGGATVKDMLAGAVKFSQPWKIENMAVRQAGKGVYELTADASTPVVYHSKPQSEALISIAGTTRILPAAPLKVDFKDNGEIALLGAINMDGVELHAPSLKFDKAAGVPSSYNVNLTYGTDGSLHVNQLACTGGPWIFGLNDLAVMSGKNGLSSLSLAQLNMTEGPVKGTLRDVSLDVATDKLKVLFEMASVDIGPLYALSPISPNLKVSGSGKYVKIQYDGKLSALQTQKFTPEDKLSVAMNTALRIDATSGQSKVGLDLSGDLTISPQRLTSQALTIDAERSFGHQRIANHLALSLDVAPREANTLLFNALSLPGLPLLVKVPISSDRLLDMDLLETLNVLFAALDPNAPPSKPGDYSSIARLRLESSLAAPQVKMDTMMTGSVAVQSVLLDNLNVTIPSSKIQVYGGEVALSTAAYNLAAVPMKHTQSVTLSHIDLHTLAGKPASKDAYEIHGLLGGNAQLAGAGFETAQRRSWNGSLSLEIQDLSAKKESGSDMGSNLKKIGLGTIGGLLGGMGGTDVGRVVEIFSDDFGIFLNQLEFEPLKIEVKINNGVAQVQRSSLIGKNGTRSAGLQLDFAGSIDLPGQTFKPDFKIWIIKLPPSTQKHLHLDQLNEADRNKELANFSEGKFQPLTMKGSINASMTSMLNLVDFASAFYDLDKRVNQSLKNKQTGSTATTGTPAAKTEPPPEEKKSSSLTDSINNMFNQKKKKK